MSCCANRVKRLAVSLNTMMMTVAMVTLIFALLLHFKQSVASSIFSYVITMLKTHLDRLSQGETLSVGLKTDVSADDLENLLTDLIMDAGIPLMIMGATLVVISGSGLLGLFCKSTVYLVLYSIFLIVLMGGESIFLYLLMTSGNVLHDNIKTILKNSLKFENYDGINSTTATTKLWAAMMTGLDCCGLDGGDDFKSSAWWNIKQNMTAPIVCCKNVTGALEESLKGENPNCAVMPTEITSNYRKGCYEVIMDSVMKTDLGLGIFAGLWSLILLFEVLNLSSSIGIIAENIRGKNKVDPI